MKNHWLAITLISILTGVVLSYLRDPQMFSSRTVSADMFYLPLGPEHRAAVLMPEARDFTARPLTSRIYGLTQPLADFLFADNTVAGGKARPIPLTLAKTPVELTKLIDALPEKIKSHLSRRLVGLYFGSTLGAYSMTDYVFRGLEDRQPMGAFVTVDVSAFIAMASNLNQWMTSREGSIIKTNKQDWIEARLENKPGDSWLYEYAVLHELGHVFSIGAPVHPAWEVPRWIGEDLSHYPFMGISWLIRGRGYDIKPQADFTGRTLIHYYGQLDMPANRVSEVYEGLSKSPFPTLMAATNPFDDFADSFASYVHTVILKKPFELRVHHGGKVVKVVKSCWDEPRCAAKRAALEAVLNADEP
jgi:hypothetical protein